MSIDPLQATRLTDLYRTDATHGWSIGMRAITSALLQGQPLPPGPLVELGCGGGGMLRTLAKAYPDRLCIGGDLHPAALPTARRTVPGAPLVQTDVADLPLAAESAACVLALDILDQNGVYPPRALREIHRILHPDGLLLVRVSAHPWLMGPHDRAFNTRRRYRADQLRSLLYQTGFEPIRLSYANALLGLLAIPPRLAQRWGFIRWNERATTHHPRLRRLVSAALHSEAQWLHARDLPCGLSLYMLARKHTPSRPSQRQQPTGGEFQ